MELKDPSGRCFCRTLGPKLQEGMVRAALSELSGASCSLFGSKRRR